MTTVRKLYIWCEAWRIILKGTPLNGTFLQASQARATKCTRYINHKGPHRDYAGREW
jgi:hypothetical protein